MGAGPGGLGAALLLAEDGHEVTVIERDEPPPGGDPEEIWRDWRRPGVPQARQIHAFFGRNRAILRAELPAVLDDLDHAGAVRLDYGAPAEDLVGIGARRTTLELVLRRRVEEHPRIDVLSRVAARGLQRAAPVIPGVPHIDGVRTTVGATVDADLVVDAAGRRSPLPRLLAELGALPPHDEAEADGFTYWTQWFRVTGTPPVDATLPFAHYDSFTAVRFTADAGWFAVCLTGAADDRVLRQLRDQRRFLAIAAVLPPTREWVDPDVATPQGGIVPMANILSRRRRLERAGKPCVTGLVSVGDAVACNNPMLGRGVALGLRHAQHLRDTLRDLAPTPPTSPPSTVAGSSRRSARGTRTRSAGTGPDSPQCDRRAAPPDRHHPTSGRSSCTQPTMTPRCTGRSCESSTRSNPQLRSSPTPPCSRGSTSCCRIFRRRRGRPSTARRSKSSSAGGACTVDLRTVRFDRGPQTAQVRTPSDAECVVPGRGENGARRSGRSSTAVEEQIELGPERELCPACRHRALGVPRGGRAGPGGGASAGRGGSGADRTPAPRRCARRDGRPLARDDARHGQAAV